MTGAGGNRKQQQGRGQESARSGRSFGQEKEEQGGRRESWQGYLRAIQARQVAAASLAEHPHHSVKSRISCIQHHRVLPAAAAAAAEAEAEAEAAKAIAITAMGE